MPPRRPSFSVFKLWYPYNSSLPVIKLGPNFQSVFQLLGDDKSMTLACQSIDTIQKEGLNISNKATSPRFNPRQQSFLLSERITVLFIWPLCPWRSLVLILCVDTIPGHRGPDSCINTSQHPSIRKYPSPINSKVYVQATELEYCSHLSGFILHWVLLLRLTECPPCSRHSVCPKEENRSLSSWNLTN